MHGVADTSSQCPFIPTSTTTIPPPHLFHNTYQSVSMPPRGTSKPRAVTKPRINRAPPPPPSTRQLRGRSAAAQASGSTDDLTEPTEQDAPIANAPEAPVPMEIDEEEGESELAISKESEATNDQPRLDIAAKGKGRALPKKGVYLPVSCPGIILITVKMTTCSLRKEKCPPHRRRRAL